MDSRRPLLTVTPTLDGDVLTVLAGGDRAFTTGEIARLLPSGKGSPAGLRKVLARLAAQGVVEIDRISSRTNTYRLNQVHLASEGIRLLADIRPRLLEQLRRHIGKWQPAPLYAALFGSWARREAGAASALDIFLVADDDEDDAWVNNVRLLKRDATAWTGNDARALVMTAARIRENPHDPVLGSILREGVHLGGDDRWLVRTTRRVSPSATGTQ